MTAPTKRDGGPRDQDEIWRLKQDWIADPCWDIEDTEGFEFHRDELFRWRMDRQQRQAMERAQEEIKEAARLGCSIAMVRELADLKRRLTARETSTDGDR